MDQFLKGKKILLLYARFFGYDAIVKKKLEELGASVDLYDARANINSFEKALRKINDKFYFVKQRKFHESIRKQNGEKHYDYIFSNDILDEEIIKQYKSCFPEAKLILYIDDSVRNMKGVDKTFYLFDRVMSFDKEDSENYGIGFRPLFYADVFAEMRNTEIEQKYDISFVGTCHSDRLSIINKIKASQPSLRYYFFCYLQSWFMYYYHFLQDAEYRKVPKNFFQFTSMPMGTVADIMHKSRAILDIQHPAQTGLTMRTIETLGIGKKLITTNADIAKYDFFDKENILIIDRSNPVIPNSFIEGEKKELPQHIYEKYSLNGWVKEIFGSTEE